MKKEKDNTYWLVVLLITFAIVGMTVLGVAIGREIIKVNSPEYHIYQEYPPPAFLCFYQERSDRKR